MTEIFIAVVLFWNVIDGDTVGFTGRAWPNHLVEERVRLTDINTPEKLGPPCERILAEAATKFTQQALSVATTIQVTARPKRDGFGRVLGKIYVDGHDLGTLLIQAGHAKPYVGTSKVIWC
jgi:endonuclease YncB( thermonuclease family)